MDMQTVSKVCSEATNGMRLEAVYHICYKSCTLFFLVTNLAVQLGIKEASIVAVIGSAGVGVSLALQGGLSNLAGGVLILMLKPFELGDYIIQSAQGKKEPLRELICSTPHYLRWITGK